MRQTVFILVIGFLLCFIYVKYIRNSPILRFIKTDSNTQEISIIHYFHTRDNSKTLKNIKLFITASGRTDSILSCLKIPEANKIYKVKLDTSLFMADNDYYWTMALSGVKHRYKTDYLELTDPVKITDGDVVNYVYVVSQKANINKDKSVTHRIELRNENLHPVEVIIKVSYFSKTEMIVWDSVLTADKPVTAGIQETFLFTVATDKLDRSEKSNVSVIEAIHLR